jgi:Ca2+-binding RTX toxin-like protein
MATLQTYNATVQSLSPLMHLRLSESAGTTAVDDADDLDGQYRGGFTLGADGPIGNGAVRLNGSTGHVVVPHQDQMLLTEGTFEVWFTADVVSGDHTLFSKNASGFGDGGHIAGFIRDGRAVVALGDLTTNHSVVGDDPGDARVQVGVPAHMVFAFGPEGMKLYLNGQLVDTNDYTGGLQLGALGTGNVEPLVLGAESGFSTPGGSLDNLQRFFAGTIDEFAVYEQALSEAQVQQLFQAGEQAPDYVGTAEDDMLLGGVDPEILRGGAGDDTLSGAGGSDVLSGDAGDDLLAAGIGNDQLFGRMGADTLFGGPGNDRLQGNAGPDQLTGGPGIDQLAGNLGPDIVRGGPGSDRLDGGFGADTLIGGAGSDSFGIAAVEQGVDRVLDFTAGPGGDVLDLNEVVDFGAGDVATSFVQLNESGGNTELAVNPTGAGPDFTPVFNLGGVTGTTVDQLVADGNLQLAAPVA